MEEQKKVMLTGSVVILLVAVVVVVYYFFIRDKAKEALPVQEVVEEQFVPVQSDESVVDAETATPLEVELDQSDEVLRGLAGGLSPHQSLESWLKSQDLIRRFVAAVDNIANGLSPRSQIDFFAPKGEFRVIRRNNQYYVDSRGYSRYNLVADVFVSLDVNKTIELYRRAKPLFQEAYAELGYPDQDFDDTLAEAIVELLKVPVVQGDMLLERKVISYAIADPGLENLSEAQKYLLRMGPENIRKIQSMLRELGTALKIPEYLLPRPRVYIPVDRKS
jgi:hypothetical protein